MSDPEHVFKEAPFTVEIVDVMRQVPRADVPDAKQDCGRNRCVFRRGDHQP
jgi:hypothetical protein